MAVPKRRTSKTRKNKRRTHVKLAVPGMTKCLSVENLNVHTAYANLAGRIKVKKL